MWGHKEKILPQRLSGRCGFRKPSFAVDVRGPKLLGARLIPARDERSAGRKRIRTLELEDRWKLVFLPGRPTPDREGAGATSPMKRCRIGAEVPALIADDDSRLQIGHEP